jgi:tripartite-type tricarboxylate transporter receptor subunit TctC
MKLVGMTAEESRPLIDYLIALAKAKPGSLNYASTGAGGTTHLAAELLKSMAGINIVHVPYKGSGAAIVATLSNETQVQISGAAAVLGHVKAGKLRGLAVTSAAPSISCPAACPGEDR